MRICLIEPRDPLIVRDGKPIGGDASIETLPFPFPSTIAGAVRTRMASPDGEFLFPKDGTALNDMALKELLSVPVAGPILAEVDFTTGNAVRFFFPAPRDAVVLPGDSHDPRQGIQVQRLAPGTIEDHCCMDSLGKHQLRPIVSGKESQDKPFEKAPMYWNENRFLEWLKTGCVGKEPLEPEELGIEGLPTETRVHVVMQPGERVAKDGGLFQTKGLRFAHGTFGKTRQFALSIRTRPGTVAGKNLDLRDEVAPIGGERRLARWRAAGGKGWPTLPAEIRESVQRAKKARIVLLTPAMFGGGALPNWSGKSWPLGGEAKATVIGACVGRPVIVSGWDLTKGPRGEKPTRRLAPAGSVYFVELGEAAPEAIDAWLECTWLQCVSDEKQDRLDGFGLAMVGVWEEGQ